MRRLPFRFRNRLARALLLSGSADGQPGRRPYCSGPCPVWHVRNVENGRMAMVSDLIGREIRDGDGRHATLVDLVVDLLGGEHPPIRSFLIECGGETRL